jgi:hypothetical protein
LASKAGLRKADGGSMQMILYNKKIIGTYLKGTRLINRTVQE